MVEYMSLNEQKTRDKTYMTTRISQHVKEDEDSNLDSGQSDNWAKTLEGTSLQDTAVEAAGERAVPKVQVCAVLP